MLYPLTVIEKLLRDSQSILRFNIRIILGNWGLFLPLLRILYLCKSLLSCCFIYLLLFLFGILSRICDFTDLNFGLIIVYSLDYLIISYLTGILR